MMNLPCLCQAVNEDVKSQVKVITLEDDLRNSNSHDLFKTVQNVEPKWSKILNIISNRDGMLKS